MWLMYKDEFFKKMRTSFDIKIVLHQKILQMSLKNKLQYCIVITIFPFQGKFALHCHPNTR